MRPLRPGMHNVQARAGLIDACQLRALAVLMWQELLQTP
jgi:hypothetical protein